MRRDFEYLFELVDGFFSKRQIQKQLKIINYWEVTGWEVWMQIEFASFLSEHDSAPEWWRETSLRYDNRKEKERQVLRPDFIIRKKGWRHETYAAIEFKQHPNVGTCLNNMFTDIEKVSKVRQSELDIRSMWVLGVVEREDKKEIMEKIEVRYEKLGVTELDKDLIKIRYIHNTPYAYILF